MTEQSAEEAAAVHARAVVAGDIGASLRGMTPDAWAKTVEIGNTNWDFSSYELRLQGRDGDDYIFDTTYHWEEGTLTLRDRYRSIDGVWKLVDVERLE